jgi:hypothetical protein
MLCMTLVSAVRGWRNDAGTFIRDGLTGDVSVVMRLVEGVIEKRRVWIVR